MAPRQNLPDRARLRRRPPGARGDPDAGPVRRVVLHRRARWRCRSPAPRSSFEARIGGGAARGRAVVLKVEHMDDGVGREMVVVCDVLELHGAAERAIQRAGFRERVVEFADEAPRRREDPRGGRRRADAPDAPGHDADPAARGALGAGAVRAEARSRAGAGRARRADGFHGGHGAAKPKAQGAASGRVPPGTTGRSRTGSSRRRSDRGLEPPPEGAHVGRLPVDVVVAPALEVLEQAVAVRHRVADHVGGLDAVAGLQPANERGARPSPASGGAGSAGRPTCAPCPVCCTISIPIATWFRPTVCRQRTLSGTSWWMRPFFSITKCEHVPGFSPGWGRSTRTCSTSPSTSCWP